MIIWDASDAEKSGGEHWQELAPHSSPQPPTAAHSGPRAPLSFWPFAAAQLAHSTHPVGASPANDCLMMAWDARDAEKSGGEHWQELAPRSSPQQLTAAHSGPRAFLSFWPFAVA